MNTSIQIRRDISLDEPMPPLSFRDFQEALELVASGREHRRMVPFLVSALQQQAPFLNGRMLMFEILCSAACLADLPQRPLNS
jgi:hypothetical protein